MKREIQIHTGRRIHTGTVVVVGEGKGTACVSDASTACARSEALGGTLIPNGVRYARASGCDNINGRLLPIGACPVQHDKEGRLTSDVRGMAEYRTSALLLNLFSANLHHLIANFSKNGHGYSKSVQDLMDRATKVTSDVETS